MSQFLKEPGLHIPMTKDEFNLTREQEQEILREYNESDNSLFLVSELNQRIIALLNCDGGKRKANRHCATLGMSVLKQYRNIGIGSQLLKRAIAWGRRKGILKKIELSVYSSNKNAISFYLKHGFEFEGRRHNAYLYNGIYVDDVIMGIEL
jgi:ribosomal protein S18 acetylase RimI-like enzyme